MAHDASGPLADGIGGGELTIHKDRRPLIALDERTIDLSDGYETRRMCDVALAALRCNMLIAVGAASYSGCTRWKRPRTN